MWVIFESWNPPIVSRHASTITMSSFGAYKHKLKKFQRWPHFVAICSIEHSFQSSQSWSINVSCYYGVIKPHDPNDHMPPTFWYNDHDELMMDINTSLVWLGTCPNYEFEHNESLLYDNPQSISTWAWYTLWSLWLLKQ